MHRRTFLGLAAALAGARIIPARAQSLAGKQIHIVVPFPPGGATDTVARPFAQLLGEALKATIVIDNRGGAGGSIGADAVAKSALTAPRCWSERSAHTRSMLRSTPGCPMIPCATSRRWRKSRMRRSRSW